MYLQLSIFLLGGGGNMSPVGNLVLFDVDVDVEVALGVFFVCTDDAVVTDDAVTNDAVAAIVCAVNPAESERTEIQVTWFSPV